MIERAAAGARRALVLFLAGWIPAVARPQQVDDTTGSAQDGALGALAGPESPVHRLDAQAKRESQYGFDYTFDWTAPYYDWKRRLAREHGLALGASAHLLYEQANETLGLEDEEAVGGIFRFYGTWEAFARHTGHAGRLEWRVENRSDLVGFQAPSELGLGNGSAAFDSGFGYPSEFSTDLSVFSWVQTFNDRRASVAIGRLSFDVYQDELLFQTFSRGFMNRAFVLNPTIGTTGIGALGAVAKGFVTRQLWLGGQIYDANAVSGEFDMDTVGEDEWLKSVEVGWAPSPERRRVDRIQLTYWEKDARADVGAPSGSGWVVSASHQWSEQLIAFTRFGHSDGGAGVPAESAASAGIEYALREHRAWSLGVGWAEPSALTHGADLDDEYVVETSYMMQLSPNFMLTPDLQFLIDPALAPDEDSSWVFGLRGILTF